MSCQEVLVKLHFTTGTEENLVAQACGLANETILQHKKIIFKCIERRLNLSKDTILFCVSAAARNRTFVYRPHISWLPFN